MSRYAARAFRENSEFLSKKTCDELWTVHMHSTDTKLKSSDQNSSPLPIDPTCRSVHSNVQRTLTVLSTFMNPCITKFFHKDKL